MQSRQDISTDILTDILLLLVRKYSRFFQNHVIIVKSISKSGLIGLIRISNRIEGDLGYLVEQATPLTRSVSTNCDKNMKICTTTQFDLLNKMGSPLRLRNTLKISLRMVICSQTPNKILLWAPDNLTGNAITNN